MKSKKIAVIRHPLTKPLIKFLGEDNDVLVIRNESEKTTGLDNVKEVKCKYVSIFPKKILDLFSIQTHLPRYIFGLSKVFNKFTPDIIISADLYQFFTWQCLSYVYSHKSTKLFLYIETKRMPRNALSKLALLLFLKVVHFNQKKIDKILVYTEQGRFFLEKHLPDIEVAVCPIPVDTNIFFANDSRREWLPEGKLRILMNARYVDFKRHIDLLQSLKMLKQDGCNFHLTLIGRAGEGKKKVEDSVAKIGLKDQVTFLDTIPLDKIPMLYHKNDVLILPSYNEAIGIVVPEAMACGLPTITSDTVGANVYVDSDVTGYIFKTGDVSDLKRVVLKCYQKEKLEKMGELARIRIEQYFSLKPTKRNFLRSLGLYK